MRFAFVASLPLSFCIACSILSVAATVHAQLTYPVRTLAITGAFVSVVALPTEVTSHVKLAFVTTVATFQEVVTHHVKAALTSGFPAVPSQISVASVLTLDKYAQAGRFI